MLGLGARGGRGIARLDRGEVNVERRVEVGALLACARASPARAPPACADPALPRRSHPGRTPQGEAAAFSILVLIGIPTIPASAGIVVIV